MDGVLMGCCYVSLSGEDKQASRAPQFQVLTGSPQGYSGSYN